MEILYLDVQQREIKQQNDDLTPSWLVSEEEKYGTLYMSQAICTLPCTTANNLSGFESKFGIFATTFTKKLRVDKTVATQLTTIHYTAQHHRQPQPPNIPQRPINTSQTLAENQLHKGQLCYMPVSYV